MTAPETPAELRARLDTLAVAACRPPRTHPPTEEEQRAWEEFATAVLDAWPAINALLARLTTAEADADRLAQELNLHGGDPWQLARDPCDCWADPASDEVLILHIEALALRERPQ
jgi:predicted transcriptional regulator